tara:strand:+ start:461 stop:745 length:285 start_codon:yes stop_codon:yes gene_type:complete
MRIDTKIQFTRVKSSYNGTPRVICNYLCLRPEWWDYSLQGAFSFNIALKIASTIGGKRYRAKSKRFYGSIVFDCKEGGENLLKLINTAKNNFKI